MHVLASANTSHEVLHLSVGGFPGKGEARGGRMKDNSATRTASLSL